MGMQVNATQNVEDVLKWKMVNVPTPCAHVPRNKIPFVSQEMIILQNRHSPIRVMRTVSSQTNNWRIAHLDNAKIFAIARMTMKQYVVTELSMTACAMHYVLIQVNHAMIP